MRWRQGFVMVLEVSRCADAGIGSEQMGGNSSRRVQLQEQAFRVNPGLQVRARLSSLRPRYQFLACLDYRLATCVWLHHL